MKWFLVIAFFPIDGGGDLGKGSAISFEHPTEVACRAAQKKALAAGKEGMATIVSCVDEKTYDKMMANPPIIYITK